MRGCFIGIVTCYIEKRWTLAGILASAECVQWLSKVTGESESDEAR